MGLIEVYVQIVQHRGTRRCELYSASSLYPCYPLASKELLTHVLAQRTTDMKPTLCTVETGLRHKLSGTIDSQGMEEVHAVSSDCPIRRNEPLLNEMGAKTNPKSSSEMGIAGTCIR
ncbi:hypothetical protein GCM10009615_16570 [Corynebacterium durum]